LRITKNFEKLKRQILTDEAKNSYCE